MTRKKSDRSSYRKPAILGILSDVQAKLERIFGDLERRLARSGALAEFPAEENLSVATLEFARSTYVVKRVPVAETRKLSPKQKEIARLILQGQPRKTIARRLSMSRHTVDSHIERMQAKLGVSSRARLIQRITLLS
jgi:DNA-binding CsgD family transcriptional regulator